MATRAASYFLSTIGRKQVVGVTGLGLSLFVLSHMLGNLLIFVGPESYNRYGHAMITNPFIEVAELGLLFFFVCHLGIALALSFENKKALPQSYATSATGEKSTSLIQKTMWHQGVIIGVFVVLHLVTFKYGAYYEYVSLETGEVIRDLHRLIIEVFHQPLYVLWYIAALVVLGGHLSHGVSSAVRTIGFNHPKYDGKVRGIGLLYAGAVTVGFIAQPVYAFFFYQS